VTLSTLPTGDLGYLNVDSLQDILFHCSPEELDRIETATLYAVAQVDCIPKPSCRDSLTVSREGSLRDLKWYTWHIWLNHYRVKYGDPVEGFEVTAWPAQK
jgi:hypothetical protein